MTDKRKRYRVLRIAIPPVFILWTILMLVLTLLPSNVMPESQLFSYDKIGHLGMFGGWTFFLGLYIIVYKEKTDINLIFLMLTGIIFGAFIEYMQHVLPGNRTTSWADFTANSLGCIAAIMVLHPVRVFLSRSTHKFPQKIRQE